MRELLNCLYVQTPGTVLHLDHDAVLARCEDQPLRRVPLRRLQGIVAIGRVSVTTPLIHRCGHDGIQITWMTATGRFACCTRGRTGGNVELRRAQHRAHDNLATRLQIARTVVAAKLVNSARFARHHARLHPDAAVTFSLRQLADRLDEARTGLPACHTLDEVRGVEGAAGRRHFDAVRLSLHHDFDFTRRTRRPPLSPFNAMLSFVYALARGRVEHACEAAGLDPQVGYLHSLRPGRSALALDLLEEHRPGLDHLCVTLVNRRQVGAGDFDTQPGGAVGLTETGRRTVLSAWAALLERQVRHRALREDIAYGLTFPVQATLLSRHLRGDMPHYLPYLTPPD